jgi:hypothetical protein
MRVARHPPLQYPGIALAEKISVIDGSPCDIGILDLGFHGTTLYKPYNKMGCLHNWRVLRTRSKPRQSKDSVKLSIIVKIIKV